MAVADFVIRTVLQVSRRVPGLKQARTFMVGEARHIGQVSGLTFARSFARTSTTEIERGMRGPRGLARSSSFSQMLMGVGQGVGQQVTLGLASAMRPRAVVGMVSGLHTEIANAELGVASLISALTDTSMSDSLGMARSTVLELRKDAAEGAGELSNYADGLARIMGPGLGAGAGIGQIRELNRLVLNAGFAMRGQAGLSLAPLDIVQALTSGASDRMTPFVKQALDAIGVSNEAFNSLSRPERFQTLVRGFGQFAEAAELAGQSWDGQVGTLNDRLKQVKRTLTEPIFGTWLEQLRSVNVWLERNEGTIGRIAGGAGAGLSGAYRGALALAPGVAGGVAGAGVGALASRAAGPSLGFAGSVGGGLFGSSLGGAVGTAFGGPLGSAMGAIIGGSLGSMLGKMGGRFAGDQFGGPGARGLLTLGGAVGGAAGGVGLRLFAEYMERIERRSPRVHALFRASVDGVFDSFGLLGDTIMDVVRTPLPLINAAFEMLIDKGPPLTEWLGNFARSISDFVRNVTIGVQAIGVVGTGFLDLMRGQALLAAASRTSGPVGALLAGEGAKFNASGLIQMTNAWAIAEERVAERERRRRHDEGSITAGDTHINGPISVTVRAERLENPFEAARMIDDVLRAVAEFPDEGRRMLDARSG